MSRYQDALIELKNAPQVWLVTGAAGFIGSNLVETLLKANQKVIGLDNFATGFQQNLDDIRSQVGEQAWQRFQFIEGDITNPDACREACQGVDVVLHQAALGSVPRSLKDPLATNRANIDGFLTMLTTAKDSGVPRFVFAGSSSTYGDHPDLPKVEQNIGAPLSPYAVTKYVNEVYAHVFARSYGYKTIGLRYFNVFGRRQNPRGPYAAVIPTWISNLLEGCPCTINGDGETSRDFCYIENVVQANILAGVVTEDSALDQIYNVAYGERTTLETLHNSIRDGLAASKPDIGDLQAIYAPFRPGDVRHSLADISKARRLLGYEPIYSVKAGLREALSWYTAQHERLNASH